ncbi:tetratricopeptide repeat protein [Candidatus Thorarchaeota archaeon]|nr:MAG: tetratricopeptide repeat protein [Candidatus Thorarchaeota archaeon]
MENSEESLASVDAYLRENPKDASAWNVKGVFHAQRKEYGEALRCFDQALQIDSDHAAAYSNKGRVLLTLGPEKAGEALKSFDRALKLKPDEIDTLRDKALALRALGRAEDELEIYKKMSVLAKDEWGIWLRLGDLQLEIGDIKGAISSYADSLKIKDDLVPAYIRRAIALAFDEQFDAALKSAETATKLDPENHEAWLIRGDVNLRAGKHKSAMKSLKKASELDPTDASVENTMGMVSYKDGNLSDAVRHLKRAIIRRRKYPTAMRNLGLILMEQENWEEASKVFTDLTAFVKNDPDAYDALATAFARLDDFCGAEDAWEKARKLYKKIGENKEAERVSVLGRAARINCNRMKKAAKAAREQEKLTRTFSSRHEGRKKKKTS